MAKSCCTTTMRRLFSKENCLKQVSMVHNDHKVFFRSQWQTEEDCVLWYLIVRLLIGGYFLVTWLLSVMEPHILDSTASFRLKKLIYLTHWAYTLCTIQALLSVLITISAFVSKRNSNVDVITPKVYKFYWLFNILATTMAFFVSSFYWALLYSTAKGASPMSIVVHGSNSIVMFIDLWLVSHPIKFLQCYLTMVFGTCYLIFTVIYYAAGGTNRDGNAYIYYMVDWRKPGRTTLVSIGVIFYGALIHFIVWGISKFRAVLASKIMDKRSDNTTEMEALEI